MYARSDMSSIFGCGQEISESLTIRSEKLGRTKSSKRKQPGGWRKEERERRVQRNDLWRSNSLAVSAAAQKPNRADTDTHTDR